MMKKIVLVLFALFALAGSNLSAQTNPNRTWKTKVSDALGLMPAPNEAEYDRLMSDLVSTGAEGVDMLVSMFDDTNNVPVSYALSGWSAFVSGPDREQARKEFVDGIIRGLKKSNNAEIKAFYIRLLQQCGKKESVDVLAGLIGDQRLGGPALTALVSNGTPEAETAIAQAIVAGTGDKNALAQAAGDAGIDNEGVETALIAWVGNDKSADKSIYYALSKIGTAASLPVLSAAAANANYDGDATDATDAYICLIEKLKADGQDKLAAAEAGKLLKKAAAAGSEHARIAATGILLSLQKSPVAYAMKAIKDPARAYRNNVLRFAAPYADDAFYTELGATLGKLKDNEAKTDIVNYLGNQGAKTALPAILPYLKDADAELSEAAMWAATQIGGSEVPAALSEVILTATDSEHDQARANTAAQCLLAYKGNVNPVAAEIVQKKGDVRGITVLAARRAQDQSGVVFDATRNANAAVAQAAYAALPAVASAKDLPALYTMLEKQQSVNDQNTEAIQNAIVAALRELTPDEQAGAIGDRIAKSGAKKSLYYAVLAKAGLPDAMETISKGFDSGSAVDKDNAFYALLNIKGMAAADKLAEIAAADDAAYAAKALDVYVQRIAASDKTPENKTLLLSDVLDIAGSNKALSAADARKIETKALQGLENNKTFQGMMLAGKYLGNADADVSQAAVMAVIRTALAHKEFYGPAVTELLKKAVELNKDKDSNYQREEVQKHLASLPATGGFVSMFNGKDLTGWKGLVENPIARAKMKPAELAKKQAAADETMRKDWVVNNGLMEYVGHGFDNICTEKQYGDFEMYVDWKLYAEGSEADAGIYLRGTPQVQIWDTARRNVGAEVGSGGLYNNQVNPSKPSKVADNKLGTWNTFYIKMVGDRVTVLLNGEKVVDNVILENFWDRSQAIFPIEQIELQAHGTKTAFRNLYINELPQVKPTELSAEEKAEGFKLLYDGTNMHGWTGNTRDYVSEDGAIVLYPGNGGGGNLYTVDEYKDFVFRFDFMLTEGANNGIGIRAPLEGDAAYVGMEIQVLDNESPIYSQLEKYQYHGSVYGVIPAKRGFLKPVGEWNSEEIRIKGNDIRVTLNGEVILEGNIAEASKNGTIDHKDHPGLKNEKGHIGFLGHGSLVKFKNIRVKEL